MKKLTAGIFATLLAVVSVGAAHAEIASKGYVDQQVGTVTTALGNKADKTELGNYATTGALTSGLAGKLDTTGTAARATADASGNEITKTYATKAEIADLATDENLSLKQDKTDEGLATTNKTVVGAINEVKTTADGASTAAKAAQTAADSKLPTATYNTQVGTVSAENMGTTASTVVTAIKEVASEAAAAQSTATGAQSAVDAVESTIGGYGDIVSHDASEFATAAQGSKADTAVQPAAISDMLTKTEAGTTYYTKTSGDALAGRVTTAEGEIDTIQTKISSMATSDTVTKLTERVTTAEGDIDDLETAVNDAESGLAATNTIADSALSTAQSAQTTANAALPKATYDTQVGTVSATNMGTTASTVVTAIKEVKTQADKGVSDAATAKSAADAAQEAAETAQTTAEARIPKPSGECSNPTAKCVLVSNGTNSFEWEVIARDGEGA